MTEAERLAIEWHCARLIAQYANLNDEGRWEEVAALYTKDGLMTRPTAPDSPVIGQSAILAAFLARPARRTRHLCSNVVIDVTSETSARGISAMVLFQPDSPALAGSSHDAFELTADGWRFAERRGTLAW